MKLVTGKTKHPKISENKVSIQLTLSGHSFSEDLLHEQLMSLLPTAKAAAAEIARSKGPLNTNETSSPAEQDLGTNTNTLLPAGTQLTANVELLTDKTVLVPRALFEEKDATAWLHMNGMFCHADEVPVWSISNADTTALMILPRKAQAILQHYCGTAVYYDSPLRTLAPQQQNDASQQVIRLHCVDQLVYIKVYAQQALQFAEVVMCETIEEFAYLLQRLDAAFALRSFTAEVSGNWPKKWKRMLKHYFSKILCV